METIGKPQKSTLGLLHHPPKTWEERAPNAANPKPQMRHLTGLRGLGVWQFGGLGV